MSNVTTSDDSPTTAVTDGSHTATANDSNMVTVSALLEPDKQNSAKTSVSKTEVSKAVPDEVMLAEIEQLELDNLHNFYNCKHKSCKEFSEEEEARQKLSKKRRMHHSWLEEKDLSYCKTTGIWWLIFSENQGVFCFLCRKHKTLNTQNSAAVFSSSPGTRYRKEALREHAATKVHKAAVEAEMNQRVSLFHSQYEEKQAVRNDVLFNAFTALYWLAKEAVANAKFFSLLNLLRVVGVDKMQYFNHKSPGAVRGMFLHVGSVLKNSIIQEVKKSGFFGLLIDEVTDIAVTEQLITFVQFWNATSSNVEIKFLSANDLLAESDSANAETISNCLVTELNNCELPVDHLIALCTDGASVMTGKNNGVAARLKDLNRHIVSIHCICHKLSLACCDTNEGLAYVQEVERWLLHLWKFFDNSPKRLAAYLKIQMSLKQLQEPSKEAKEKCVRRLAKATWTRWLSLGKAIEGVHRDYIPLMLTLKHFEEQDAQASGLLGKMHNAKFIGVVTIMNHILPVLNRLSCTFQQGKVSFAHILPALEKCIDDLNKISQTEAPITEFQSDLSPNGRLRQAELTLSDRNKQYLRNFLPKYVSSLKESINNRFPTLPLLSAFSIFNPAHVPERDDPGFSEYGNANGKLLAHQYFDTDSDRKQFLDECQVLKYDLLKWKKEFPDEVRKPPGGKDPTTTPTDWCLKKLLQLKDLAPFNLPLVAKVANAVVSLPVSNAWPERGASALKLLKTRLRSRMQNDLLNTLLHILINGPAVGSKECEDLIDSAISSWLGAKTRRKCPPKIFNTGAPPMAGAGSASENVPVVIVHDAGVQTTDGDTQSFHFVAEEVEETSKALELPDLHDEDSDYGSDFEFS